MTVNIHEAKTHLSRLLAAVEAGEEVLIARNGTVIARLVSVQGEGRRVLGRLRDSVRIPRDFDRFGGHAVRELFEGKQP